MILNHHFSERPWLTDDVDSWLSRFKEEPHKLAVVFADNSGADIMLGLIPFVRELLKRGTKVEMIMILILVTSSQYFSFL